MTTKSYPNSKPPSAATAEIVATYFALYRSAVIALLVATAPPCMRPPSYARSAELSVARLHEHEGAVTSQPQRDRAQQPGPEIAVRELPQRAVEAYDRAGMVVQRRVDQKPAHQSEHARL